MILPTRLLAATLVTLVALGALTGCRRPPASNGALVVDYTNRVGFLVVVDSIAVPLDAADGPAQADALARLLRGRVIDSVRVIPSQQATALYGSRAANGVLRLWLRP